MKDETFLCVSTRRWNSLWRNTQQILSRIAVQNRVIYFEPGRDPDGKVIPEFLRNLSNFWALDIEEAHPNVFVVKMPSTLPAGGRYLPRYVSRFWLPVVSRINSWIIGLQIQRVIAKFEITTPVLWLYSAGTSSLVGKFGEKLSCYYNYDEGSEFSQYSRVKDILASIEEKMLRRVDIVFASSNVQAERRRKVNPNTLFVPNAVDFELFNQALRDDLPVPADIASLPRPVIGFAGWLGYHIDVSLLRKIAERFVDCSLVLVGPDQLPQNEDSEGLHSLPNVFFLGQKSMTALPSYLKAFDAALMPWLLDGHVRFSYPLKLHEYLAAGRASVATFVPELLPFRSVVRIAETHEQFLDMVGEAILDKSPESIERRVAIASQNTWDQRISQIYKFMNQFLENGKEGA